MELNLLIKVKEAYLLEILDEQLTFVIQHIDYIHNNSSKIEACMHFMQRYKKSFFEENLKEVNKEYKAFPKKEKISFLNKIMIKNFFSKFLESENE